MRRGSVFNLRKLSPLEFLLKNRLLILACLCFLIGFMVANFTYSSNEKISELAAEYLKSFLFARQGKSFISIFLSSAFDCIFVLLCFFISGTSMLGMVIIPFLIIWRGFYYGALSAVLYTEYALKGVAFNALVLIPPALVFLICVFTAAGQSLNFSSSIAKLTIPKNPPRNLFEDFKDYSGKYILIVLGVILTSLMDAGISSSVLHFFEF